MRYFTLLFPFEIFNLVVNFVLRAHLNFALLPFKCSRATHGCWLLDGTATLEEASWHLSWPSSHQSAHPNSRIPASSHPSSTFFSFASLSYSKLRFYS